MIIYDCATELNEIVNHPEVIGGHLIEGTEPPLDVSSSLERGGFGVLGDGFGFLLAQEVIDTGHVTVRDGYLYVDYVGIFGTINAIH